LIRSVAPEAGARCNLDHPSLLPTPRSRFCDGSEGVEDVRSFAGRFSNSPQYLESLSSMALSLRVGFISREQSERAAVAAAAGTHNPQMVLNPRRLSKQTNRCS
jgi:hypothetical protein